MTNENPYRLPRTVIPNRYELTLTPDLRAARFSGEERVEIDVVEATNTIRLNAIELDLISVQVVNAAGDALEASVSLDKEAEVATLTFDARLSPGQWTLHITFTGTLNDKLRGFYRSTFKDDSDTERVIATTQFEATDARRAFPCWDEPDFKAVFAITLIVDEELAAFSNGSVSENDVLGNGKRQVTFEDTMKMSTYLVAFVVGPLATSEVIDADGVPLRVACVPGREQLTKFALDAGTDALRYYSSYFGINYPGGKVDMIALPDFAFGAMENLGCITYRETALLVDPERASRAEIERVAEVVGHEIAHMWFGDLVTMKWWNGIWLNEAFATFMENLFVDQFRPEWQRWTSFGLGRSAAMGVDSLTSTRPIEFTVTAPEEAQGMFDLLTYEKGGSVLRMLEQHMGAQRFATGVTRYLNTHAYANAETTDLWDALEQSSGEPVRAMMDTWIFQGGHPIIHAAKSADGSSLDLSQHRFRYLDDSSEESPLWHVPIGIRAYGKNSAESLKVVLTEPTATVALPPNTQWVVVNEHSNGFFRTNYDDELLQELISNASALEPVERFTLMMDTWAASLAGQATLEHVFTLVELLSKDTDPNVWSAMLGPIVLTDKLVTDPQRRAFVEFIQRITTPLYEQLGWEPKAGEAEQIATLRAIVIGTLGGIGEDQNVRAEAERRYADYQSNTTSIAPDLVGAVEGILAATNKPEHYETLYAKFKAGSSTPQEAVRALGAVASFTDEELVTRTLNMILERDVRTQDAPYTVRIMLSRRNIGPRVWAWCEEHWSTLTERFPDNSIVRMFDGVSSQLDTELAASVETFMATHPVPQAQKSVDQTCERLRVNVAWAARNQDAAAQYFAPA